LLPHLSVVLLRRRSAPARLAGNRSGALLRGPDARRAHVVRAALPDVPDLAAGRRDRARGCARGGRRRPQLTFPSTLRTSRPAPPPGGVRGPGGALRRGPGAASLVHPWYEPDRKQYEYPYRAADRAPGRIPARRTPQSRSPL